MPKLISLARGQGSEAEVGRDIRGHPTLPTASKPPSQSQRFPAHPPPAIPPVRPARLACVPSPEPGAGGWADKAVGHQPWLGQQGALELMECRTNGAGASLAPDLVVDLQPCLLRAAHVTRGTACDHAVRGRPCPLPGGCKVGSCAGASTTALGLSFLGWILPPGRRARPRTGLCPAPSVLPAPPRGPRASHPICFEALELPEPCSGVFPPQVGRRCGLSGQCPSWQPSHSENRMSPCPLRPARPTAPSQGTHGSRFPTHWPGPGPFPSTSLSFLISKPTTFSQPFTLCQSKCFIQIYLNPPTLPTPPLSQPCDSAPPFSLPGTKEPAAVLSGDGGGLLVL